MKTEKELKRLRYRITNYDTEYTCDFCKDKCVLVIFSKRHITPILFCVKHLNFLKELK